jgi:hypothetical protein
LTYFPGVGLTERALRDGHIVPDDVEHLAQKGYDAWGGAPFDDQRRPEALRWDIANGLASRGAPPGLIVRLLSTGFFERNIRRFAWAMSKVALATEAKHRLRSKLLRKYDLKDQYMRNAMREIVPVEPIITPSSEPGIARDNVPATGTGPD